jgi:uncharacterized membrane protein YfcA
VGAVQRFWRHEVELKTGLLFAVSGMAGAPLGTWIGSRVSERLLLALFAALMVLVAIRMWRKASKSLIQAAVVRAVIEPPARDRRDPACRRDPAGLLPLTSRCLIVLLFSGIVSGILAGLFGVGGGFAIVPALVLLTGMSLYKAVATSLLVIALISGAGLVAHLEAGRSISMAVAVPFSLGGILGLGLGAFVGRKLPQARLQQGFAVLILALAAYVVARNLV